MSLRVLLADESASIRKVFQLGLQDFGAEVKSVHNGLDVIEVAEQFQPDIIFADILLQKKNGYEVSHEIAQHSNLKHVPVVLMWSSFMELDQDKYKKCKAKAEMEKPFEVDVMRNHIENLVDRTKDQQLSQFLTFPQSIAKEFVEEEPQAQSQEEPADVLPENSFRTLVEDHEAADEPEISYDYDDNRDDEDAASTSIFNLQVGDQDFDAELEDTEGGVPLMPMETQVSPSAMQRTKIEDSWETKALNDNSIEADDIEDSENDLDQFQSMELNASENLKLDDFLYKPEKEGLKPPPVPKNLTKKPEPMTAESLASSLDPDEIEAIVRAHTQEIIKLNIQELLPKIIERVVREELEKAFQQELAIKSAGNP